ncbi:MAG TPA: HRDC domain-containing protein, partial [Hyphomonadaceae bacterium]
ADHGGLRLLEDARPVLRGERKITLRRDQTKKQVRAKKAGEMPASAQGLFDDLRAERARIAREQGVPPYVVFHDSTLRAMAAAQPKSLDEMAEVPGVGQAKLARYGERFLKAIQASG